MVFAKKTHRSGQASLKHQVRDAINPVGTLNILYTMKDIVLKS